MCTTAFDTSIFFHHFVCWVRYPFCFFFLVSFFFHSIIIAACLVTMDYQITATSEGENSDNNNRCGCFFFFVVDSQGEIFRYQRYRIYERYAARFGFPGKTNRSWGWLGGDVDDDPFPWEDEDEEEDEEEGEDDVVQHAMAGGDGQPAVSTGEVVGVKSREDLRALTEEGETILFVSSRSCRACKYLTP